VAGAALLGGLTGPAGSTVNGVRVAVGSDEDTPLLRSVAQHLADAGHAVEQPADGREWPEVGRLVAEAVAEGRADFGVVCCWTGTGVSIAANKVAGVRAALCHDAATAEGARRWNDANVLALSNRSTAPAVASEILDAWLASVPDPSERAAIGRLEH
jgi:ribose 5-phosphate isomerase B